MSCYMAAWDTRNIVHLALHIQEAMRAYVYMNREGTYTQNDVERVGVAAGMKFTGGHISPALLEMLVQCEQSIYMPGTMPRLV